MIHVHKLYTSNANNKLNKTISIGTVNDTVSKVQKVKTTKSDFLDPHEILIGSYLKKKSALNKHIHANPNFNKKHSNDNDHMKLKWLRYHEHVYWCVLRRNQFSYYKTEDEKEAVAVIPRENILNYKISYNNISNSHSYILFLYTKDKTYTFKFLSVNSDDSSIVNKWALALDQFLNNTVSENEELSNEYGTIAQTTSNEPEIEEEEHDDEYNDIVTINNKTTCKNNDGTNEGLPIMKNTNTQFESDPDKSFFETFDPNNKSHIIFTTLLYVHVKSRFNRTKWKHLKCELTNQFLNIYSVKTNKLKKSFDLDSVIDCIEIDNDRFLFALITSDERIEFKALNDEEMIEWIINFKSTVLIRTKYKQH
ncbi:hypothetical protein TPHA_0A03410 [Tetrapisispora phaffii CBS 4417]|uniref:PH domain-containing protein n=1 Tax=Tetrapisispora phaffii (strain ATCC 24235 / CBS 4417 / NBRC 1672 / NRRL Y-8282 / UCD 70-5) TaxID=1071381 RepID=G8BNE0_TETPH|nr:hypothetical protein TPHA_0A03410 [Tetrapisispora phaffii CBS 4417]CCE61418.1 hypothetical protein TPHA_0A03410 [Tetrapisispora phaffii CBS 4417]